MPADDDVQQAPRAWSVAVDTKALDTKALEVDLRPIKAPACSTACSDGQQPIERWAAVDFADLWSSPEGAAGEPAKRKPEVERAAQRLTLMRAAQPALMPDPHYLDKPPPGMMELCHRESVVQFINEVREAPSPTPHALRRLTLCCPPLCPLPPASSAPQHPRAYPQARCRARHACPSAPESPRAPRSRPHPPSQPSSRLLLCTSQVCEDFGLMTQTAGLAVS